MKEASDDKVRDIDRKGETKEQRKSFVAPHARILVVDDSRENLLVIKSLLKRTAIFIDTASNGEACIRKVRENSYDLILLDYMMPQMSGIDTIRELQKDPEFHIPVIALSADVTKGIEQTFLEEGFCAYLSKPVVWTKLEELLVRYLRDDLVVEQKGSIERSQPDTAEYTCLKNKLKQNDILMDEGLKLLDGDFMQYRKLMEFFAEYQEEQMKCMDEILHQQRAMPMPVDELTRMMHTLKSNAKAIGAINLYEIAKEMESRGKQKDTEYICAGYFLLKFEWSRVLHATEDFLSMTQDTVSYNLAEQEDGRDDSKEEIKEKLKVLIMRYQAKEAGEQIQYLLQSESNKNRKAVLKEMSAAINRLDFDEAEVLMKRWEGME